MTKQGEIEAAVFEGIRSLEEDFMGRVHKIIHSHLIGDLVMVRVPVSLAKTRSGPWAYAIHCIVGLTPCTSIWWAG
jgi:uncharacterized protein YbcI